MAEDNGVTLIYAPICPFAERAHLALLETGAPFTTKEASLTDKQSWFTETYRKAHGADLASDGKVPVLVDARPEAREDDKPFVLVESSIVAEYAATTWGGANAVNPHNLTARQRALGQLLVEQTGGKLVKGFYALLGAQDAESQAKATAQVLEALREIGAAVRASGGPFTLGSSVTLTDLLIWPWIARFGVLSHYRGFSVPSTEEYSGYHTFVAAMRARPSVATTQRPDEFYIDGYRKYTLPK